MSVHEPLDELTELVTTARAMPMSASCIVHRGQVLDLLEEIRQSLPGQIREADALIDERDRVIAEAHEDSDRIVERAVSQEWVHAAAVREAELIRSDAEAEAARMRREVDDYVDGKLANFEIALQKTLAAVERGRDKIRARTESEFDDAGPLPG